MEKYELMISMIKKYQKPDDYNWKYPFSGEHDEIYSSLPVNLVPEESDDGKLLMDAGWFVDDDSWKTYS